MASFTRLAIRKTFLLLLEQTPLDKITVKMIVDACGISRNTFYYHYEDIPALLQDTLEAELGPFSADPAQRKAEGLQLLAKISANRRVMEHIYHSSAREQLQQRLWEAVLGTFRERVCRLSGGRLSADAQEAIAVYFSGAAIATCLHWVEYNATSAPEDLNARLSPFDGLLEHAVQQALAGGFCDTSR